MAQKIAPTTRAMKGKCPERGRKRSSIWNQSPRGRKPFSCRREWAREVLGQHSIQNCLLTLQPQTAAVQQGTALESHPVFRHQRRAELLAISYPVLRNVTGDGEAHTAGTSNIFQESIQREHHLG